MRCGADLLAEALSTGGADVRGLLGMVALVVPQHLPHAAKAVPAGSANMGTRLLVGLLMLGKVDLLLKPSPTRRAGVGLLPGVNSLVGHQH